MLLYEHIEFIIGSASKKSSIFSALKYKFDRKSLVKVYKSFERPSSEYADVVWDNLTEFRVNRLEKIQIDYKRTITGVTRSVSMRFLPLRLRRKIHRLTTLHKILHQTQNPSSDTNSFIRHQHIAFPHLASQRNSYSVRPTYDFSPFPCKTEFSQMTGALTHSLTPSGQTWWFATAACM